MAYNSTSRFATRFSEEHLDMFGDEDYYSLAIGNVYEVREYARQGAPLTGPGARRPDVLINVVKMEVEDDREDNIIKSTFTLEVSDGSRQNLTRTENKVSGEAK